MKRPLLSEVLAVIGAVVIVGCGSQADDQSVDNASGALYSSATPGGANPMLWPGGIVPVCFANVDPNADYSKMLRNEIESKWGRYGNIAFTGWGTCSANPGNVVRINNQSNSAQPHSLVGRQADGVPTDMWLDWSRWSGCESFLFWGASDDECFRYVGMHEFGHALGFLHEQARTDTPSSCNQGDNGDLRSGQGFENPFLTPYDADSIMNYCNHNWNNDGELSAWDIVGLQSLYGRRNPGSLVGRGGRNVDVQWGNSTAGTPVWLWENNGSAAQLWSYSVSDGTLRAMGMCLDDPSGNHTPGTQMTIQNCGSRATARWDFSNVTIRAYGGKCLDRVDGGTANGTKVQLYYCTGAGNQRWTYDPSGELKTGPGGSSAKCLDTYPGGNNLQLYINDCVGDNYQQFDLTAAGEIRDRRSGKCLDVENWSKEDGTRIQLYDCTTWFDSSASTAPKRLNQKFNFTSDALRGSAGNCVDAWITDISVDGIPVKVNGCNGYKNQMWDYYFRP